MSLPDSITLNDGTVNEVYGNKQRNGNTVTYYAPSPNVDIAGRPVLYITQEVTKAGIARATVSLTRPLFNSGTGKYDRFMKTTTTSTMSAQDAVLGREKELRKMGVFTTTLADEVAAGDL